MKMKTAKLCKFGENNIKFKKIGTKTLKSFERNKIQETKLYKQKFT